ncbi:uncharacterized protein LOC144471959 isoform X2 [Augochlora pura]
MSNITFINFQHLRDRILNIGRNIKTVEEFILGTDNNFKRTFNEINKSYTTFKREAAMERKDVDGMISNKECIIIDSSGSDSDNSYCVEDFAYIEFFDTPTVTDASHTTESSIVDIEIIEDNNNDSKNNFDSIESYEVEDIDLLPGCNNDFDKEMNSKFNSILEEEAIKIHSLLPHIKYQNIFATLQKNRTTENRVLLTLWDLLPYKRPYGKKIVGNKTVKNNGTISQIQNVDNSKYRIQNKILQPAKLKLNESSRTTTSPVKNMFRCTKEYDGNESNNKMLFPAKNVFKQNLTNNFGECMNNYMQYLQCIKIAKSRKGKKFNFVERNRIRQFLLGSQFKKPCMKIKENNELKVSNILDIPMLKHASHLQDTSGNMSCSSSLEQLNEFQYTPDSKTELGSSIQDELLDEQQQLQTVVPVIAESSATTQTFVIEERKEFIQEEIVLTSRDADEIYLRKKLEYMKGNANDISDYIIAECKNPTYITKEEVSRRIKIRDQHNKYSKNFDIRSFLDIYPNPFQHFKNPNRQCKFNEAAFKFLKLKFSYITEDKLQRCYEKYKYNLTLTAEELQETQYNIDEPNIVNNNSSIVNYAYIAYDDTSLMHELVFITYEVQISDYMSRMKEEEIKEFEILKNRNELWQCECCYDSECMPSQCFTCSDGHIFCKPCIKQGIQVRLAESNTCVTCFLTCEGEFSFSSLKKALSPREFSFLLNKIQEAEVVAAGITDLVSCPFCPFASIPPSEDKIFKCLNPECMKESCRLCKKLNHVPSKCYEENNEKARLLLEEKMTEALVRTCSGCSKPYYKTDGCNLISCACGAKMCYICDKAVTGYSHFDVGKCLLHTNNDELHNDTIDGVADATLKYIAEKDPNVQIDLLRPKRNTVIHNIGALTRVKKVAKFDE